MRRNAATLKEFIKHENCAQVEFISESTNHSLCDPDIHQDDRRRPSVGMRQPPHCFAGKILKKSKVKSYLEFFCSF